MRTAFLPVKLTTLFLFGLVAFFNTSCSYTPIDNDAAPEIQYAEGERLLSKDRIIEAIDRFRILKSRYPYSKYAALATLKIGDAHFQSEAFIEAASSYKIFRELYPKHEMSPYALYRIGESNYNLVPSTADRDLEPAASSIDAFQKYLKEYPTGEKSKEVENRIKELRTKLAEKEIYVGDFYYKQELYGPAAGRYSSLILQFADLKLHEEPLYKLAFSFERMGEYKKTLQAIDRLKEEFPKRADSHDVKNLRAKAETALEKSL